MGQAQTLSDLGLSGDGDELDLLVAFERSFGLEFGAAAEGFLTLGDMHAWLVAKFGVERLGQFKLY